MGLSEFEECSCSSLYCSPSIDRSLTTRLIELSNNPFKCSSCFAHRPEWVDGLDRWSPTEISNTKNDLSRRHLDFHNDIGLYLPRHEKPNSAPITSKGLQISSKIRTNNFTPDRIRQLLNKEKDLLLEHNLSDEQSMIEDQSPPVPSNTFRQSTSIETLKTTDVRLPLRQLITKSPSPPPIAQQHQSSNSSLNQDTLKCLLKEHLTSLLTRGASTLNANRTLINTPSAEIKQQSRSDSKLIEERSNKFDEINSTLTLFQQSKISQTSPLGFHQKSSFGLTVTPVDLASQRNFQSVSLEKMAQQKTSLQDNDSSSISSSRPSTQPVPVPQPTYQQQKVNPRKTYEATNSSCVEMYLPNENYLRQNEQCQTIQNNRKIPPNNRSSSKTGIHRTTIPTATTIELLPPIISGKRLHIPIANHRYL